MKTSGSRLASINCQAYTHPIFVAKPTDTFRKIYPSPASDVPVDVTGVNPLYTVRAPANAMPDPGTDAHLHLIDENHRYIFEMWNARKRADGDFQAPWIVKNDLQGSSIGQGVRAYGGSAIGGEIRKGELTSGIPHALSFTVPRSAMNKNGPNGKPYMWPAVMADGGWETTYGSTGNLFMGSLLAIPQNVDITKIGVGSSGPAYEIAKALQTYGSYNTDASCSTCFYIGFNMEPTACGELAGLETLGIAWDSLVIPYLKVVTNNGPTSIGGGGIRQSRPSRPPLTRNTGEEGANRRGRRDEYQHNENFLSQQINTDSHSFASRICGSSGCLYCRHKLARNGRRRKEGRYTRCLHKSIRPGVRYRRQDIPQSVRCGGAEQGVGEAYGRVYYFLTHFRYRTVAFQIRL